MKIKWTLDLILAEAAKYGTRGEFAKFSKSAYNAAWKMDILDKICSHMGPPKSEAYTYTELKREALKYETRGEFQKNSPSAYQVAYRRNILNKICKHMYAVRTYWTEYSLQLEANKYSNRSEFQKHSNGAYSSAWKKGHSFLSKICAHMNISNGVSLQEMELFEYIKNIYPNAKKLKDSKVKISEAPYIKGFEIDIFIPELNKGIEFDGKYYHSFEYMRKSKRKALWADDEILNYHNIKDSWFVSKGIKIIHIEEEDWILNKQNCIENCLKFLNNNGF